ncbi:MAG: ABC transporter permease subunit [Spirochaetes bacterium]|nr:ABC transporter permease subunit [Spirochaetota bacterium]
MMRSAKKELINKTARALFAAGGVSVLIVIILILIFLFKETIPVFSGAEITGKNSISVSSKIIGASISERGNLISYAFQGGLSLVDRNGANVSRFDLPEKILSAVFKKNTLLVADADKIYLYDYRYVSDGSASLDSNAELISLFQCPMPKGMKTAEVSSKDDTSVDMIFYGDKRIQLIKYSLGGNIEQVKIDTEILSVIKSAEVYFDGSLIAVSEDGRIYVIDESGNVSDVLKEDGISAFGMLTGKRGFVVADLSGNISVFSSSNREGSSSFHKIHKIESSGKKVTSISLSDKDRTFAVIYEDGSMRLYYSTTEKLLLEINDINGNMLISGNGKNLLSYGSKLLLYDIKNNHPDISFKALFGKIWYEGYSEPAYVWQSTGGADDFEPKYSLMPLIFGTVKGSLFALLFAVPLALCGALFMNQFMHPDLQRLIKPAVEIMAGLPSVIIGFLGGLWLAPVLEQYLPGILLGLVITPVAVIFAGHLVEKFFTRSGGEIYGKEIFIILPVIVLVFGTSIMFSNEISKVVFNGDFKDFFFTKTGTPYDQRNAIVVGFAMGFAVIPVIFSLAEDALSFVPREIIAGSLALGLSRWQTVSGVVLKAAKSGIVSAVMIGFGRAVGETMIVLMATGNTPLMSLSPFNGFRTLSANIAVELPETAVGSSPYRILFLSALILFIFTFAINILTGFIRGNMRKESK